MSSTMNSCAAMLAIFFLACSPEATMEAIPPAVDMATSVDQQPAESPCPSGRGVAGDVLLCADFSKIQSLNDPKLGNWNFKAASSSDCWEISNGLLRNKDTANFNFSCAVSIPALDVTDISLEKYSFLALSVRYKLEVKSQQSADILLTANDLVPRIGDYIFERRVPTEGVPNIIFDVNISVEKRTLPISLNNIFKPYIRFISDPKGIVSQGWQIYSLAVIGIP